MQGVGVWRRLSQCCIPDDLHEHSLPRGYDN
jgi:hypothetical protein